MREAAGLWHWRSQTRAFRDGLRPLPPGVTNAQLDDGVREAVAGAVAGGLVTSPIDGDLAVAGMAYSRMPEPEWRRVNAVTEQRLHALNWLCGYAPDNDWELTPLTA